MSPKRVGFVEAVKLYFYNYSNFSGRSTESEFGWIILFNMLASIPFEILDLIVFLTTKSLIYTFIPSAIWVLATLVPNLSLCTRRLHDTGHSALLLVVSMILPLVALMVFFWSLVLAIVLWFASFVLYIVLIIFLFMSPDKKNKWGEPAASLGPKNGIVYGENKETDATVINSTSFTYDE